jgi:hypothetical protein
VETAGKRREFEVSAVEEAQLVGRIYHPPAVIDDAS